MVSVVTGDTSLGLNPDTKVYKTKEDVLNKTVPIIDASVVDNLCYEDESFAGFYHCDYEKIYETVKNDVNKYTYEFKKTDSGISFVKKIE